MTAREAVGAGKAACHQCIADYWVPTVKARFPNQVFCEAAGVLEEYPAERAC